MCLSDDEAMAVNLWLTDAFANQWYQSSEPLDLLGNPPFIIATDASTSIGWGYVELEGRGKPVQHGAPWSAKFAHMDIFLLEICTAIFWIKKAISAGKKVIVLACDNTGAVGALRKLYSTNKIANNWLKGLARLMKEKGTRSLQKPRKTESWRW
jgi:hypothetical protein